MFNLELTDRASHEEHTRRLQILRHLTPPLQAADSECPTAPLELPQAPNEPSSASDAPNEDENGGGDGGGHREGRGPESTSEPSRTSAAHDGNTLARERPGNRANPGCCKTWARGAIPGEACPNLALVGLSTI